VRVIMSCKKKIIVIGAGPAGLSAGISAAQGGDSVEIYEKMPRPALKLLASGGGKCNLTNISDMDGFTNAYGKHGRFCLPGLKLLPPERLMSLLEERGVRTFSPDGFHIFPESNKSSDILGALLLECERLRIRMRCDSSVEKISIEKGAVKGIFCRGFEEYDKLVMASGGMGYPSLGGGTKGYELAKSAGHSIIPPVPALVELNLCGNTFADLSGISLQNVKLSVTSGRSTIESSGILLFTHNGISGPAILDVSGKINRLLCEKKHYEAKLSFLAAKNDDAWRDLFGKWRKDNGARKMTNLLTEFFPLAFARKICSIAGAENKTAADITSGETRVLSEALAKFNVIFSRAAGFEKAMATNGGVSTKEINPDTLESRIVRGLHFAGEIIDIDGPCGGYNLQWAFSSGWLAGSKQF